MKLDVPYLDQSKVAPTGCESVSAVMLLNYLGCGMSVERFIDACLDKEPFETVDGRLYGPHPAEAFAGDPYSPDAMGCYAPVLCRALERAAGERYTFPDETGTPIEELLARYVDRGFPVLLWATIDLKPYVEGPSWYLRGSGERFTWRSNEHCMLLVGYDAAHYICNDPWNNNGVVSYPRALVEQRHREQYMQAVGVCKRA